MPKIIMEPRRGIPHLLKHFIPVIIRNTGPLLTNFSAASLRSLAAWPPGRLGLGGFHEHREHPWVTLYVHELLAIAKSGPCRS